MEEISKNGDECGILEELKLTAENYRRENDDERAAFEAFGIKYLFPWQRIVIANIMDCAMNPECEMCPNQIVLLPTGAGKSLCFLTPALLLDGPTMVLYPLLALMADQKRRMDEGGIKSVVFRGGMTEEEREQNFTDLKNGARIILANPEVLQNRSLVERLKSCNIRHIAIDEAHCVSEWGDTFRPAYLTLGNIIKELNPPAVTAFTATASPEVLSRVSEVLFAGEARIVRSDSDRPNIWYKVVNAWCKKRAAFELAVTERKPMIIFCGTRAKAQDMAFELSLYLGYDRVRFYHAGMEKEEKTAVEKWFYPKEDAVLCCTCAYGMGVDKKDIHTVVHLEPSPTAESYIQEAGRGGRDGSVATGILLWSKEDSLRAAAFKDGSREKVLKHFAESRTCRRQVLLDALGGEQAVCSGCDICRNGGPPPFASDAALAYSFIRRHRKMYGKNELTELLIDEFNRRDVDKFKTNVWSSSDVGEVIVQLKKARMIHECAFPWRGKFDTGAPEKRNGTVILLERRLSLLRLQLRRRVRNLKQALRALMYSGGEASSGI